MNTETERVTENVAPTRRDPQGNQAQTVGASTLTTPAPREIHVERWFAAPRDRVWRAFTERDQIARWWGRGNELVLEKHELRPGGEWRFVEHAPDGVTGFQGIILEVEPQSRIVQTFEWDGMTGHPVTETADFEEVDGRTLVKSTMQFFSEDERDEMLRYGMAAGMEQSYAALDQLLRG